MPYFKNKYANLLFIHIPKTGGTSIEDFFSSMLKIPLDNNSLYDFLDTKKSSNKNIIIDSSMQHMTYKLILKYKKELNIDFTPLRIVNAHGNVTFR